MSKHGLSPAGGWEGLCSTGYSSELRFAYPVKLWEVNFGKETQDWLSVNLKPLGPGLHKGSGSTVTCTCPAAVQSFHLTILHEEKGQVLDLLSLHPLKMLSGLPLIALMMLLGAQPPSLPLHALNRPRPGGEHKSPLFHRCPHLRTKPDSKMKHNQVF